MSGALTAVRTCVARSFKDWGEEIPSGGGMAPGATRLRVATPAWWQNVAAEQLSKALGKAEPFVPAPFLMGVQGDFLDFDSSSASKFGLGNFDAAFVRRPSPSPHAAPQRPRHMFVRADLA